MTKFVLECLPPGEELDTVRDLREKIDLSPPTVLVDMQSQNAKRRWGKSVDTRDLDTLVLRILRSSLTTHRALADSWLKAIEEVRSVREQKVGEMKRIRNVGWWLCLILACNIFCFSLFFF